MADKLRCAVIGMGSMGMDHLHSLGTCHRAAAVAVSEVNPQRLREACARFNIARSYADYRVLLEQPDVDAVTIALPTHLHAPVAADALKARKHVLLEQPMTLNAKEAGKLMDLARNMKRVLMVAHPFRFHRHAQSARMLIDRGDLGEIYHARCFSLKRAGIPRIGSWYTQKQFSGGGCLQDLGVNLLDAAFHLMRENDVVSVSVQTHARFGPRGLAETDCGRSEIDPKKPFDVEDYAIAMLKLKSGRSVVLETGWACFHQTDGRDQGIDLLGSNGGLSLFPLRHIRNIVDGFEVIHHTGGKAPHGEDRLHHFVAGVLDGKKLAVPPEESLKLRQVLDALYASASSGKEVRLS